jgi:hypothetical protein
MCPKRRILQSGEYTKQTEAFWRNGFDSEAKPGNWIIGQVNQRGANALGMDNESGLNLGGFGP